MSENKIAKITPAAVWKILILTAGVIFVSWGLLTILPRASDWSETYRPASLNLVQGKSPYLIRSYVAPPWLLIPLIPLAVFPEPVGRISIFWLTIASYALIAHKYGAKVGSVIALLVSYPVVYGLIYGQVDWLAMLGILLTPWLGLGLLMGKPQVGIGVAIFLGYDAWKIGGIRKLIFTFLPLACLAAVCYLIFGSDLVAKSSFVLSPTNASFWPRSLPIGLVILVASFRSRKKILSLAASPFLAPYLSVHSWASAIVGLADDPLYPILISAGSWVVWALGGGAVNG